MRRFIPISLGLMLVLGAVVLAALASSAAAGPERKAAASPPARQIAALKQQVRVLRNQLATTRSTVARLQQQNAALTRAGIARNLDAVKAANDKYRAVDAAVAAGYVPSSPCESSPAGGMGIHYVNAAVLMSGKFDPLTPPILVYAPTASGLELVAAEYFKPDADQDLATDGDRPSAFGRAFDGPMLGHSPTMPKHFDVHVWLWKRNPSGMFAQWNPDVRCS